MSPKEMRIANPDETLIANESDILEELLPLSGAAVLELGCGNADKTRLVAEKAASVHAMEVDEVQLAKNQTITDMPNVRFEFGAAEKIPAPDSSYDIVMMFKSLHHVPVDQMDQAFSEIIRVMKPGGIAYISEPVYDGSFNEIMRLFHDEKVVREAAFEAEKRAVQSGRLKLIKQIFFHQRLKFESFDQFDENVISVTFSDRRLSPETLRKVKSKFEQHMTTDGAQFLMPMRIDVFSR